MKLTFYSNACCEYEQDNFRILADPWLIDGAFEGSWAHYPPLRTKPQDLADVSALYISHLHPDHFDRETLKHFRRKIPIFVLDHGNNFLIKLLEREGFTDLVKVKDRQTIYIGPFKVTLLKPWCLNPHDDGLNLIDSAAIFEAGGHKVLNTNDATPTLDGCHWLNETYGRFDVAQLQFNSAGPYPSCFKFDTHEERQREHERIVRRNLSHMLEMAKILKPGCVMPFAGQYIIQGKNWEKNYYLGTSTPEEARWKLLRENGIPTLLLNEGQSFDLSDPQPVDYRPIEVPKMRLWAQSLADRKYSYECDPPAGDLTRDFLPAAAQNVRRAQERLNLWPDCDLTVNGYEFTMSPVPWGQAENKLVCKMDERLLLRILLREAHWNNAEIGTHIEFERQGPYMPNVHTLMSFFHVAAP